VITRDTGEKYSHYNEANNPIKGCLVNVSFTAATVSRAFLLTIKPPAFRTCHDLFDFANRRPLRHKVNFAPHIRIGPILMHPVRECVKVRLLTLAAPFFCLTPGKGIGGKDRVNLKIVQVVTTPLMRISLSGERNQIFTRLILLSAGKQAEE